MKIFEGYNLNNLFSKTLVELIEHGREVSPRGKLTKEFHPYLGVITRPNERFLSIKARKNNIFAQMAEILWVLGGKEDMEFLSYYLPNAKDFSDNGKIWRAAYGPRLRNWHGKNDQIKYVVDCLKKDPDSRQAVITIWDPAEEIPIFYSTGTKDYPCFTYDTIVHSPQGNIKIGKIPIGYPVYCYDEQTETINIRKVLNSGKTGKKRIWRVYLDDNSFIETTENHKFMTKTRKKLGNEKKHGTSMLYEYKEVKNLKIGEQLLPINYIQDHKGYKFVHLYPKKNWSHSLRIKESRLYWEYVNGPINFENVIHHRNGNKNDNRIENLSCITSMEHDSIFTAKERSGKNNPNYSNNKKYQEIHKPRYILENTPEQLIKKGREILKKEGKFTNRNSSKNLTSEEKRCVTYLFGSFSNFKSAIYNNHKITRIEKTNKFEDVYDIEVEDCNNFFVGSGVLVHNCSNWLHFLIRDNKLDCELVIRSNDIIWGFSSVNIPEFTTIQAVIADILKIEVGKYFHFTSSLHIYDVMFDRAQEIISEQKLDIYDYVAPSKPSISSIKRLDAVLETFFKTEKLVREENIRGYTWDSNCLIDNYQMACFAYVEYKEKDYKDCLDSLFKLKALDIKLLCLEFVCRKFKKENKTELLASVAKHINEMKEITESSGRRKSKLISYITGVEITEVVYG